MTNLNTAKRRRAEARARHDADMTTLERGRQQLAAAQGAIDKLAAEDTEAIARHARRLEQHARAGKAGGVPSLVPSDKHLAAQVSAQRTHAAAGQMVAALEVPERQSAEALRMADAAVHQAALDQLGLEAEELAAAIERDRLALEAAELRLRALRELTGFTPSARALAAMHDDLHVPVFALRSRGDLDTPVGELQGHVNRGAAATAEWQTRLEELEAGDGDGITESAAA